MGDYSLKCDRCGTGVHYLSIDSLWFCNVCLPIVRRHSVKPWFETLSANLALVAFGCEAFAIGAMHPSWHPGCGWSVSKDWTRGVNDPPLREEW